MEKELSFYQFTAKSLQGQEIEMSQYRGKVVLVVNTASRCGFTPQYQGLQQLYLNYKDKGLVILGFPCNQFLNQEPGTAKEIAEGCLVNYGVTFQVFDKIEVNGNNAHPIFKFLKKALPGWLGQRVKWNFSKFLINVDGTPVKRFAPITKPQVIEKYIKSLLINLG